VESSVGLSNMRQCGSALLASVILQLGGGGPQRWLNKEETVEVMCGGIRAEWRF
jgi:hypothetical protein